MLTKRYTGILALSIAWLMAGCAPVLISAMGVGAGAVFTHHSNGQAARTFSTNLPRLRLAVAAALKKMSITPGGTEKTELGERIFATAGGRRIEIELEVVTASSTLMRTVARTANGLSVDAATAIEITNQTANAVGRS